MNWFLSWIVLINIWLIHFILTGTAWWWWLIIVMVFTVLMVKAIFTQLKWSKVALGVLITVLIVVHAFGEKENTAKITFVKTVGQEKMLVKNKYTNFLIVTNKKKQNFYLSNYYYQNGNKKELRLEINDQITFCYQSKPVANQKQQQWLWNNFRVQGQIFVVVRSDCQPVINQGVSWYSKIHRFLMKNGSTVNRNWIRFLLFQQTTKSFQKTKNHMQRMGIVHLFVVSGFHLIVLTKIWFSFTKVFKNKPFKISSEIVGLAVALFLVYLTNWKFSAVKAFIFILLNWSLAKTRWSLRNNREKIATIILGFLLFNPLLFYRTGFQLSCLASWTLMSSSEKRTLLTYRQQMWKLVQKNTLISIVVLPIIINIQYQMSIFTTVFTLFYSGLIVVIYPLFLFTIWFSWTTTLWTKIFMMIENNLLLVEKLDVVVTFGQWKRSTVTVYYCLVICLLAKKVKEQWKILLILIWTTSLIMLTVVNWQQRYYQMHFINVGHGLAILLQGPDKKTNVLFDAGIGKQQRNDSNRINRYLKQRAVNHLDAVFISHNHADHRNNLTFLSQHVEIERMIFNKQQQTQYQIRELKFINWAHPYYWQMKEENNRGLVLFTQINGHKILLTFDLEETGENRILQQEQVQAVDILQVGHHGAANASSVNFLKKLDPRYCVISSNHDQPKALTNLKQINCQIFNTKHNNHIVVTLSSTITINWH